MPTPKMSLEMMREAWEAYVDADRSRTRAANALGLARGTFEHRLNKAKEQGFHLSEGARNVVDRARLRPSEAKGGWIHDYDADGKKVGTTRWSVDEAELQDDMLERIRGAFADIPPAPDIAAPQHSMDDLITVYPLSDVHIGMMAWGEETGEDYDTRTAVNRVTSWVGRAVASSPESETAIILDVGDLLHADDQTSMTPRSKHILDVDTRHFQTLDLTIYAIATSVDLARAKHKRVIVRILPGNHNPTSYMAVMFALAERYRNDDRVEVQKVPGEFFTHEFGKCLIAAHHGDKSKAERMVMYLADEYAEVWGRTRHRYLWTGHLHHHKSADIGGVTWEQLRAVTSRDAYAASHAYVARSQLQAITYHRDFGEVQRVKISGP